MKAEEDFKIIQEIEKEYYELAVLLMINDRKKVYLRKYV